MTVSSFSAVLSAATVSSSASSVSRGRRGDGSRPPASSGWARLILGPPSPWYLVPNEGGEGNGAHVGYLERAKTLLEEVSVLGRTTGDKRIVELSLLSLGITATLRGNPKEAKALLKESLMLALELGSKTDIAETLKGLAGADGALGEPVRAARLWGTAHALREAIDAYWRPAERQMHEPLLNAARSRLDEAPWEAEFAEGQA
jgi:hypothetical protein